MAVSLEEALKEIAARYDLDRDGKLSYKELNAYLLGVLGNEWAICSRPQKNIALLTAIGQDVVEVFDRGLKRKEGSVTLDAIAKWTLTTANASETDKKNMERNLALYGFVVGPQSCARSANRPVIAEGTFDAILRARIQGAKDKTMRGMAVMDVTNTMLSFKIAPAKDLQEELDEVRRWEHMAKVWAEDAAAEKLQFLDPVSKKFVPAAQALLKELFNRTDADHDGRLNADELAGWSFHIYARSIASDFDAALKAGGVSEAQLEEFYTKNPQHLRDLKVFLIGLGVDERLAAPAKDWPAMTFDGWALGKLASDYNAVASALRMRLMQHPPVLPSPAVRHALAAVPDARRFLCACAYLDALAANSAPPAIESPSDALAHMWCATQYLAWGVKPRNVPELESLGVAFADKHIAEYVAAHRDAVQAELHKLLGAAKDNSVPEPLAALLKSTTEEPQAGRFPDPLWRTLRAFDPTWLALLALDAAGRGGAHSFPEKLVLGACKAGGAATAAAVAAKVPPYLGDWLKASAAKAPLPDVLGSDAQLADASEAEVTVQLSSYLGLALPQLAQHFAAHKITRGPMDSVASTIVADAKTIVKSLKVPGGRHALAAKLLALVQVGRRGDAHYRPTQGAAELVKRELRLDLDDAAAVEAYPLRVVFCATMGHHGDAFHPAVAMQSYYLTGDYVGGSAECMLVNKTLLKPEEAAEFTADAMRKKLAERLNAPKAAAWESHPAVLYFGDMLPYLIRTACCFEAPGTRYRVEPAKLYALTKDVCFAPSP